jgi:hypothetical protein
VQLDGGEHAGVLVVQLERLLADRERRPRGVEGMIQLALGSLVPRSLEDHHEPVPRRLVDVAVVHADDLEKTREVRLHELAESLGLELLAEPRITGDIQEQDGDLLVALLQRRRRRIALEQVFDRVRHELAELTLELLEQFETLPRRLEMFERGGQLRVTRRQLAPREGRCAVISLIAAPSSATASPEPAGARTSKSPSPIRPVIRASSRSGRTTTWRMATARTPAAAPIVRSPMRIWRLRCRRTSANTGPIDVATRTTARTRLSLPWHPWHRSWFAMGWCRTNNGTPLSASNDSWGCIVSTARAKSGLANTRPGSRLIFWIEAITSFGSSASLLTCCSVARSVKASTPFLR